MTALTVTTNANEWAESVRRFAAAALVDFQTAFRMQARLLAGELIQRTPPFSGRLLRIMGEGRAQAEHRLWSGFSDPDVEDLSAKAIGERRVEKDIRRVIYGVNYTTKPVQQRPNVFIAQTHAGQAGFDPEGVEWGVLQKCEGKPAVRIFATRSGEVYGVDLRNFAANATDAELEKTHEQHRGKRGRVTTAGSRDKVVGRWRWLEVLVTSERRVKEFIDRKKKSVGQGKGGWVAAFKKLGGRISDRGWIGRHQKAGSCEVAEERNGIRITLVNHSRWASGGDPDRVIEGAMAGRTKLMGRNMIRVLEKRWGKGAGGA